MNILFVNSSRVWGGNEKWTLRAAETLQARGHTVLMAIRDSTIWRGHGKANIEKITLSFTNDADVNTILGLRKLIKKRRIDIILPTRSRDYWLSGFARMGTRAKYIMRMGITRKLRNTIKERLRYGKFPDGIVVNAEAVKQSIARYPWVKAARIRVIYNGVDLDEDSTPLPPLKQSGEFLIVAAGRVESDKGFDILIDASAKASKEIPNLRTIIFGRGDKEESLKKQISELGLSDRIELKGFTTSLSSALAQADLAVSSSYREGISNFILEAWSAGAPVIATAIPGSAEIVVDNIRGRLVPPGDSEKMSSAIVEVYNNSALRNQWITAGRKAIDDTFNWNRMGEELETFLRAILSRT